MRRGKWYDAGAMLSMSAAAPEHWCVYVIRATDGTLYTGITTDMDRRWSEHLSGEKGAKYFRGRKPEELVFTETGHNRSSASKREAELKKLSRAEKLALIAAAR